MPQLMMEYKDVKIIYVINDVDSAFNSQVAELLKFYRKYEIDVNLIVSSKKNHEELKLLQSYGINIYIYGHIPDYPLCEYYHSGKLRQIFSQIVFTENTIIHTRGHVSAFFIQLAIKPMSKQPVIFPDFRGAIEEEIKLYYKINPILKKLKCWFYSYSLKALNKLPAFSAVSSEMQRYVLTKQPFFGKSYINTCIAGSNFYYCKEKRINCRKELGIKDNEILVVFSSGGNDLWQQSEVILNALKTLNCKILILGKNGPSNEEGIINLKVSYRDVPSYLCAADIGILYRKDDVVNRVAAPIKFSEYMSCGLPVIVNDAIPAVIDVINRTGYGVILKDIGKISNNDLDTLLTLSKDEISMVARKEFGIEKIGNDYLKCYIDILTNNK